jgi:hypothetical protein
MKIRACWDEEPCSLVRVDRRFRGVYYLHRQGETTRRYNTEGSNLHICRHEKLKSNINPRFYYVHELSYILVTLSLLTYFPAPFISVARPYRKWNVVK